MTQRTVAFDDALPLYVCLTQLEQAVQGEDVPEVERLAVMGDIARRAANVLATFEIKYPEVVHMDEKASQEAVLLDLGSGSTLQGGYDEIAEMAFIYGADSGEKVLPGCYWDYQELLDDGDSAPARVLGALALAGVPLLNAEAVRHAVLAFLQNPPQSKED